MSLKLKQFVICYCCSLSMLSCNKDGKHNDDSRNNINEQGLPHEGNDGNGGSAVVSTGNSFDSQENLTNKDTVDSKIIIDEEKIAEKNDNFLKKIERVAQYLISTKHLFIDEDVKVIQTNYDDLIETIEELSIYVKNNQNIINDDIKCFKDYAFKTSHILDALSKIYGINEKNESSKNKINDNLKNSIINNKIFDSVKKYTRDNEFEIYSILVNDDAFKKNIYDIQELIKSFNLFYKKQVQDWQTKDFIKIDEIVSENNEKILCIVKKIIGHRYTLTEIINQKCNELDLEKHKAKTAKELDEKLTTLQQTLTNAIKEQENVMVGISKNFKNYYKNQIEINKHVISNAIDSIKNNANAIDDTIRNKNISKTLSQSRGGYPLYFLYKYIYEEQKYCKDDDLLKKFNKFEHSFNYSEGYVSDVDNEANEVKINDNQLSKLIEDIKEGLKTYIINCNTVKNLTDEIKKKSEENRTKTTTLIYQYINYKINICRNLMAVYKKDKLGYDPNFLLGNSANKLFDLSDDNLLGYEPIENLIKAVFDSEEKQGQISSSLSKLELNNQLKITAQPAQTSNGIENIVNTFFDHIDDLTDQINNKIKEESCDKAALAIKHFSAFWVFKGAFLKQLNDRFKEEITDCYKAIKTENEKINAYFEAINNKENVEEEGNFASKDKLYNDVKEYGNQICALGNKILALKRNFSMLQECLNDYFKDKQRKSMDNPFLGDENNNKDYYANHKYIVKVIDEYFKNCFESVQKQIIKIIEDAKKGVVAWSQHEKDFLTTNNKKVDFAELYNNGSLNVDKCPESFERYLLQTFFYNYKYQFDAYVTMFFSSIDIASSEKYQSNQKLPAQGLSPRLSIEYKNDKYTLHIDDNNKGSNNRLEDLIKQYYKVKSIKVNGTTIYKFKKFDSNINEKTQFESDNFFQNKIKTNDLDFIYTPNHSFPDAKNYQDNFVYENEGKAKKRSYANSFYKQLVDLNAVTKPFLQDSFYNDNNKQDSLKHIHVQKIVRDRLALILDIVDELWIRISSLQNIRNHMPDDNFRKEFNKYVTNFRKNFMRLIDFDIVRDLQQLANDLRYEFCSYLGACAVTSDFHNAYGINPITDTIIVLRNFSMCCAKILKYIEKDNISDNERKEMLGNNINSDDSYIKDDIRNCKEEYLNSVPKSDELKRSRNDFAGIKLPFNITDNKYNTWEVDEAMYLTVEYNKSSVPVLKTDVPDAINTDNLRTELRKIYTNLDKSYNTLVLNMRDYPRPNYNEIHYITTEFLNRTRYDFLTNKSDDVFTNEIKVNGKTETINKWKDDNKLNNNNTAKINLEKLYKMNTNASMFKNIGMAIGYLVKNYDNYRSLSGENFGKDMKNIYRQVYASGYYWYNNTSNTVCNTVDTERSALCMSDDNYFTFNHEALKDNSLKFNNENDINAKLALDNNAKKQEEALIMLLKYLFSYYSSRNLYYIISEGKTQPSKLKEIVNNSLFSTVPPVHLIDIIKYDEIQRTFSSDSHCAKAVLRFASLVSGQDNEKILSNLSEIYKGYNDFEKELKKLKEAVNKKTTEMKTAFNKVLTKCFKDFELINLFKTELKFDKKTKNFFDVIKNKEIEKYFGIDVNNSAQKVEQQHSEKQDSRSTEFYEVGGNKVNKTYLHKFCEFLNNKDDYLSGKEDFIMGNDYILQYLKDIDDNGQAKVEDIKKLCILYKIFEKKDDVYKIEGVIGCGGNDVVDFEISENDQATKGPKTDDDIKNLRTWSYHFITEAVNSHKSYYYKGGLFDLFISNSTDASFTDDQFRVCLSDYNDNNNDNYQITNYNISQIGKNITKYESAMSNWQTLVGALNATNLPTLPAQCWLFLIREIQNGNIQFNETKETISNSKCNGTWEYEDCIYELLKYVSLGVLGKAWNNNESKHPAFDRDQNTNKNLLAFLQDQMIQEIPFHVPCNKDKDLRKYLVDFNKKVF